MQHVQLGQVPNSDPVPSAEQSGDMSPSHTGGPLQVLDDGREGAIETGSRDGHLSTPTEVVVSMSADVASEETDPQSRQDYEHCGHEGAGVATGNRDRHRSTPTEVVVSMPDDVATEDTDRPRTQEHKHSSVSDFKTHAGGTVIGAKFVQLAICLQTISTFRRQSITRLLRDGRCRYDLSSLLAEAEAGGGSTSDFSVHAAVQVRLPAGSAFLR